MGGLAATFSVVAFLAFAGKATAACDGYTYAGMMSVTPQAGVSATITALDAPRVQGGHVVAWVGIGGEGLGPGTSDEWFQAGIGVVEGDEPAAYYELVMPGSAPRYVVVGRNLVVGRSYRVAIRESRFQREWWAAWLDRTQVTPWIHLPASHGAWRAVAIAEALNDGAGAACNAFTFRFANVLTTSPSGVGWNGMDGTELTSAGGRIVSRDESGFIVAGGSTVERRRPGTGPGRREKHRFVGR